VTIAQQVRQHLRSGKPYDGPQIETGEITIDPQDMRVIGPAPRYLNITAMLLDSAPPRSFSFTDGVLTLNLLPAALRYRPLYWDDYDIIAFERIDA